MEQDKELTLRERLEEKFRLQREAFDANVFIENTIYKYPSMGNILVKNRPYTDREASAFLMGRLEGR